LEAAGNDGPERNTGEADQRNGVFDSIGRRVSHSRSLSAA